MSWFKLRQRVGSPCNGDPHDTVNTRAALTQLGYYKAPPGQENWPWPDSAMLDGIFLFQYDNGLRVDGVMRPGGPTKDAINRKLASLSFADGNHYDPNQPRESNGRWGSTGGAGGKSIDTDKRSDTVTRNASPGSAVMRYESTSTAVTPIVSALGGDAAPNKAAPSGPAASQKSGNGIPHRPRRKQPSKMAL